ncbi:MAG: P-II family nitrogen regulator [Acidobacteria bacterium]|nr:P-II family nitrogen regulator [Acidobacteriota bacterium]MCY4600741.1 P-II family nitrogen regulator [Acidobacteriota bacterium]
MKLVTAIIKPHMLDDVRDTLSKVGVTGLTVTEVRGFGRQKGHTEIYRGAEYSVDFVPKIKIEIVVSDERADAVIDAVKTSARTGQIGDGKIFVCDMEQAIRIRTSEAGDDAL